MIKSDEGDFLVDAGGSIEIIKTHKDKNRNKDVLIKRFVAQDKMNDGTEYDAELVGKDSSNDLAVLKIEATGLPALADDSGIAVDALNGEPGIYSARYGFDDSLDDWGRLLLLLKNTEHVPDGQRQARFVCVISFVTPDGTVIQARGEIHGELTREPAGENGFGYDPIFYYPPLGKTTAELSPQEKNEVSHRANALKLFYEKMKEAGYADK